jgi:hypothetical protein
MPEEEKKSSSPAKLLKEEKDKNNALLAGVIFFMLLIIVLWAMNLKTVLKSAPAEQKDSLNINKLSQDFQNTFNEVGAKMEELKKIDAADLNKYPLLLPLASTTDMTIKN